MDSAGRAPFKTAGMDPKQILPQGRSAHVGKKGAISPRSRRQSIASDGSRASAWLPKLATERQTPQEFHVHEESYGTKKGVTIQAW